MNSAEKLERIERELDLGWLFMQLKDGRWWKLHRAGKTKTWKRRKKQFIIPVRVGYQLYELTNWNYKDCGIYLDVERERL